MSEVVELLSQTKGEPKDISKILSASISNNVLSLVSNQRLPMGHPERDVIDHGVESFQTIYNPSGIIVYYPKLFRFVVKLGLLRLGQKLNDMMNMNKTVRYLKFSFNIYVTLYIKFYPVCIVVNIDIQINAVSNYEERENLIL